MPNSAYHQLSRPFLAGCRYLLLLTWIGLILWLSLDSSPPQMGGLLAYDKLLHGLAYGMLAWLLAWVMVYRRSGLNRQAWWQAWILTSLFGGVLEILQRVMQNGRTAEWGDLLADASAALIVCVIFRQVYGSGMINSRPKVKDDG